MIIAVPIMIQNFITNFVNMLDNIMVGALGTEEMSGVAIINQLIFIFNLTIFGAISSAGIFTSQFYGRKDDDGIRYTLRFKGIACALISIAGIFIFIFLGDYIINMFLHDGSYDCDLYKTHNIAKEYMMISLIGLIPYAVTQVYAGTLRETGETFVPMAVGFMALIINAVLNYIFIFGKFGFPKFGVNGAAFGTIIARIAECIAIISYVNKNKYKHKYFSKAFRSMHIPKNLFISIGKRGVPLLLNEFLWSVGMSLISMSYSYHGLAVVAGYSISSTVINLFNITFMSFGTSIGIIAGKYLGANDFDAAMDRAVKLITFALGISVAISVIVISVSKYIPMIYNTSAESKKYAEYFIRVSAAFMPVTCFTHASYFTIRCGGKTFITFLLDSCFICFITVPVAFLLYFCANLSIWAIFPAVQSLDIIKAIIGFILLKKRVWVNNIIETF